MKPNKAKTNDTQLSKAQAKALNKALAKPPSKPTIQAHMPMPQSRPADVVLVALVLFPRQPDTH